MRMSRHKTRAVVRGPLRRRAARTLSALPRTRERETIRVQEAKLVRFVAVLLPRVVNPTQISIPADRRPEQFQFLISIIIKLLPILLIEN